MNDLPDKILIRRVKAEGCNDSFKEICRRYERAFYKICHKYTPALINAGVSPQDMFDEKNIIILNCVKSFKACKKTKLSTHICNYARFLCLNSISERKALVAVDSNELRKFVDNNGSIDDFQYSQQSRENYDFLKNLLNQLKDERISEIIHMRHLSPEKKEWKEIAKKMNISSQTVINLHERGMKLLRTKLQSKEFADIV